MEIRKNGTRFYDYIKWENKKHQPYDYERYGLLKHLMSHKIIESKNTTLQYLLSVIEESLIMVMRMVDRLKHFKDYAWTNR